MIKLTKKRSTQIRHEKMETMHFLCIISFAVIIQVLSNEAISSNRSEKVPPPLHHSFRKTIPGKENDDDPIDGTQFQMKISATARHHRVRRMLGTKMKCFPVLRPLCHVFYGGNTTKKFCIVVKIRRCYAVD